MKKITTEHEITSSQIRVEIRQLQSMRYKILNDIEYPYMHYNQKQKLYYQLTDIEKVIRGLMKQINRG